jgi:GcrA cell cycle regulator
MQLLWVGTQLAGLKSWAQYMGILMTNGWTDDRVTLLKRLWTDGLSASQIAKQLGGVTRNAVIGKVHRLGLAGRAAPSRPIKRIAVPTARPRPVLVVPPHVAAKVESAVKALDSGAHGTIVKPIAKPVAPPQKRGDLIGVLQLGANMCKWPIGDPGDPEFGFCGAQCSSGAVYCTEHAAIAFQPALSRRQGSKEDRAASEVRRLARLANF